MIFFDTETTGTNVQTDRIVQIALVKENGDNLQFMLNPGIPIPKEASDVHGITDEMVKGAPTFAEAAPMIISFIGNEALAGFNINTFDVPLLCAEFERIGVPFDMNRDLIDVGNLYKILNPRTLSAAYKDYTGEELEGAHGALADTLATVEVYKAMLAKGEISDEDIPALALQSNFGRKRADISGKFRIDDDGDYIFSFGKHVGNKARLHLDYVSWMSGLKDMPSDSKKICMELLNPKK